MLSSGVAGPLSSIAMAATCAESSSKARSPAASSRATIGRAALTCSHAMFAPWIPGASALGWGPMSEVEEFRYSVGHEGYLRGLSQYGSDQSDAGDNEDEEEQRAGRELEEKHKMKAMDRAGGET